MQREALELGDPVSGDVVARRRCCPGAAAGGGMCLVFPWWYDVVFPIRRGVGGWHGRARV